VRWYEEAGDIRGLLPHMRDRGRGNTALDERLSKIDMAIATNRRREPLSLLESEQNWGRATGEGATRAMIARCLSLIPLPLESLVDPRHVQLAGPGLPVRERFLYEYDFIDNWQHDVRLEQILPLDSRRRYPVCIAGRRAAPPEDCGGPWAFLELRQHYSIVTIADRMLALLSPLVADGLTIGTTISARLMVTLIMRTVISLSITMITITPKSC
jgi:hypothetical protein